MMPTQKGLYKPKFPEKYKGNPCNIVFRSSWEYKLMKYFDLSGNIVQWQSEELWIPYRSPIDRKVHRYFPDFLICVIDKNGNKTTKIIEVKPKKQTIPPKLKSNGTKPTKRYLTEVMTYGINSAKWNAAKDYCSDRKWEFLIFTEKELGLV